ncbi:hypothetical protein OPW13_12470 [Vibrio europaeus]|uniref:Uncharacterized protein n=1 Tax=Vibrio europaeus TaxID=300876 RepID=A0A178JAZ6_9VIBR|nr:hypothetical protein [Vibrio europaeus]MDC5704672.1 hypothetical protein [Vibrio europaeus]MDC5711586.1 hypothetical protein [Vibrio europaeus]MDC5713501.1 hypothetical protein [Vibrio europaeus]MDC5843400.1 hypothetical protein [Vibrio europaeus]MDC5860037.1 hypothetical protein [Vibrio europaeus]
MSYIIPPPIKIEFPEQVALSDSIGGSRTDVAASELAVKLLADQMRALGMTNLLINPRGKINQANESDGVIAADDYFCDGWKAGANGAQVYRLADGGFDLRSGSIVQLIPNDLEALRLVRTNLDVISGSPVMKVNGAAEKAVAGAGEYIEIEVSGDNSKFTRLVAAESTTKPLYQQMSDELAPCEQFYRREQRSISDYANNGKVLFSYGLKGVSFPRMTKTPAVEIVRVNAYNIGSGFEITDKCSVVAVYQESFLLKVYHTADLCSSYDWIEYIVDARP